MSEANRKSAYEELGVDPNKRDVHTAVHASGMGGGNLFPGAFCKIMPDVLGDDDSKCVVQHEDGVGSKIIAAYLHYKETGDASWFQRPPQDCLAMNLDDMACVGATDRFLMSNTIDRNPRKIDDIILTEIMRGYGNVAHQLQKCGILLVMGGGETADLPNNVRTITANASATARFPRADVIDASRIEPGDVIIGLSAAGKAVGEALENSGMGSNGLTLALHASLNHEYYEKYHETIDPETPEDRLYRGPYALDDRPEILDGMSIGEALSSPTRIFLPTIRQILQMHRGDIHGIFHNTGGGLGKAKDFGNEIAYIKDRLPSSPPIFQIIAEAGEVANQDMPETFNLGILMEIIAPEHLSNSIIRIAEKAGIQAWKIGVCRRSTTGKSNVVVTSPEFGTHTYHPKH